MNILREVRRLNRKSMTTRIILVLIFSVIFIINTYAWFSTQRNVELGGISSDTTPWDVSYYVNGDENQILDEITTFTIDELYPGMPNREDTVHIYNLGTASTKITYEIMSVKIFGQEVLDTLKTTGEITNVIDEENGTVTVNLFAKETQFPFNISYTYDHYMPEKEMVKLVGQYVDDTATPRAHGTCKFHVNWPYLGDGTDEENLAKDMLDTKFGKDAYTYYQKEDSDPSKAVEIKVKVTSSMIHPKDDDEV